jgi:ketosteroid isomerase-like protein
MEDSVELVRRVYEAFSARDIDAFLELCDSEIEFFPAGTSGLSRGGAAYRGHAGIGAYFADVERTWEELRLAPQTFRALGDHVLVRGRVYARARDGLLIDSPAQWVWRVENSKIVWASATSDQDDQFGLDPAP